MLRFLCALGVLLAGAGLLAPEAFAHGGMFRGPPKPPSPPPLANPPDLTPPPPPPKGPPRNPPTTGKPPAPIGPGGPSGKAPTTPTTPPGARKPGTPNTPTVPGATGPGLPTPTGTPGTGIPHWRTKRRAVTSANRDDWTLWWQLNGWAWMPTRHEGLRRRLEVVTPSGGGEADPVESWERRRVLLARTVLVPSLVRYLNPTTKVDDEVRAAALIALARTTHDPLHVDLILSYARNPKAPLVVRESACIAAGLLRRTEAPRPLDAIGYDLLRHKLVLLLDDDRLPTRARAMCALSVGLLADQPYASPFTKDGRLITRILWERLNVRWSHPELPIVIVTALGMQPPAGVPASIREGLEGVVFGKRLAGIKWTPEARSHALTARLRIGGSSMAPLLMRILPSRRLPVDVKNAAWLGLAGYCDRFTSKERMTAYQAFQQAYPRISDPIQRGFAFLALGRLFQTDLAEKPDSQLLYQNGGPPFLLREARVSTGPSRGFAALALGLAASNATGKSRAAITFRRDATKLLRKSFEHDARAIYTRGAYALALGLVKCTDAAPEIAALVGNRREQPVNRRYGAEALAMLGSTEPVVRESLRAAVVDRRAADVRAGAAVALSALAMEGDADLLLEALDEARTEREIGHIALAIGHLGNLDAARRLIALARNKAHLDENRALALSALGLLLDPELRPSLTKVRQHANYPARTNTLHEAFDIL